MRTWGSFSTLEKGTIVVGVLLFVVLQPYAGLLLRSPMLYLLALVLPFVLLFSLIGFFQFVAWAAGKLCL
jgi:ATP/ADP translocase